MLVLDGLDASGKSTQASLLSTHIKEKGMTVCVRTHPSNDNVFGRYAGRFLYSRGRGAHFASAFFYMFDVFHSIFLYSWQRYDITIFVRYLMGAAYLPSPLHVYAYRFFSAIVPRSRAMFFLDVPPEVAFERIRLNRDKREMFEDMSSLRKVRARALSLTTIGRWILIDARGPPTGIEFEIRRRLGSMRFLS